MGQGVKQEKLMARNYAPGEIPPPGGGSLRIRSPPGDYARSCFQDGSSAPMTNTLGGSTGQ